MGIIFDPLDDVFGNLAKIRLLRVLFWAEGEMSGREAARRAQISHVAALRPLTNLTLLGIIIRKTTGRQHLYALNPDNLLVSSIAALFRSERERVDDLFATLQQMLLGASNRIVAAYLIGSAVRGEDRPGSDLDLLVLVKDRRSAGMLTEEIAVGSSGLRDRFGVTISPIVLALSRFLEMLEDGDAFAQAAVKEGRALHGPSIERLVRGRA
jgi:predicted nucleotidyltransferase